MKASYWFLLAFLLAGIALVFFVRHYAAYPQIDFDEAYNLQISRSIADSFCYCTAYEPTRVFPTEESVNGPPQYAAALFFATTHSPDAAKVGAATLGMALLVASLLLLEPWLVLLTCTLFFTWFFFFLTSITFGGEIWALAFAIFGIAALRHLRRQNAQQVVRDPMFVAAALLFGLAIECKLLVSLAIFPIALAIFYERSASSSRFARIANAAVATFALLFAGLAVLAILVAFSVAHSSGHLFDFPSMASAFVGFITNMIGQGSGQANGLADGLAQVSHFSAPVVLALAVTASAVLLYANFVYLPFVAITFAWCFFFGHAERHTVMSLYLAILLGTLAAQDLMRRYLPQRARLAVSSATVAVLMIAAFVGTRSFYGTVLTNEASNGFDRKHIVQTSTGLYHYSPALVAAIRRQPYVVTSGWWQFPEISMREGLRFHDRMRPETAALPRDKTALLFDAGNANWPPTSRAHNCRSVIYRDGPLLLCAVRTDVPLNYDGSPPLRPFTPAPSPRMPSI